MASFPPSPSATSTYLGHEPHNRISVPLVDQPDVLHAYHSAHHNYQPSYPTNYQQSFLPNYQPSQQCVQEPIRSYRQATLKKCSIKEQTYLYGSDSSVALLRNNNQSRSTTRVAIVACRTKCQYGTSQRRTNRRSNVWVAPY